MVLRRIPGGNWGTKISTFSLILLAGVEEIFRESKQKILNEISLEALTKQKSVFLSSRWSQIYAKNIKNKYQPILIKDYNEDDLKVLRFYYTTKIINSFWQKK